MQKVKVEYRILTGAPIEGRLYLDSLEVADRSELDREWIGSKEAVAEAALSHWRQEIGDYAELVIRYGGASCIGLVLVDVDGKPINKVIRAACISRTTRRAADIVFASMSGTTSLEADIVDAVQSVLGLDAYTLA